MNILSAPIFEGTYTFVRAAVETVNSNGVQGRYHITENGGIVFIDKPRGFDFFITLLDKKFKEQIENEIQQAEYDNEELTPYDFDLEEVNKFSVFLKEVMNSDFEEFIIESM